MALALTTSYEVKRYSTGVYHLLAGRLNLKVAGCCFGLLSVLLPAAETLLQQVTLAPTHHALDHLSATPSQQHFSAVADGQAYYSPLLEHVQLELHPGLEVFDADLGSAVARQLAAAKPGGLPTGSAGEPIPAWPSSPLWPGGGGDTRQPKLCTMLAQDVAVQRDHRLIPDNGLQAAAAVVVVGLLVHFRSRLVEG